MSRKKSLPNSPKLLLVEDNHIALVTLENTVDQAGFRYTNAVDGESALDLVKSERFDLIVTDVGLPGLSGLELAKKIRQFEKDNQRISTPIIGLTAHAKDKIKNKCIRAGMNDIFTKPINSEVLENIKLTHLVPVKSKKRQKIANNVSATEEELFKLDAFSLLDADSALAHMGNNIVLLQDALKFIVEQEIPNTIILLKKAYKAKDWTTIEKITHKMRGGIIYCGTEKLIHACQYLEQYHKDGHSKLLHPLYKQLFAVIDQTKERINQWLIVKVASK